MEQNEFLMDSVRRHNRQRRASSLSAAIQYAQRAVGMSTNLPFENYYIS